MQYLKQYRDIERGEFIVAGGDGSEGASDWSCCQFISKSKRDVPLVYHSPKLMTEMTNDVFPVLERIYDITNIKPLVAWERNNGGVFEMERLAALNRNHKYDIFKMPLYGKDEKEDSGKLGWDTNTATRPAMLGDLKDAVDKRILGIYDQDTIGEMFSFIICQTSTAWKAQHEKNAHDDMVLSLAIAYQLMIRSKDIYRQPNKSLIEARYKKTRTEESRKTRGAI